MYQPVLSQMRSRTLILAVFLMLGVVLLIGLQRNRSPKYSLYTGSDTTGSQSKISPLRRPRQCVDPYRQPGLLFYRNNSQTNFEADKTTTQYVPYADDFYDQPDPPQAKWPTDRDADFSADSEPPADALARAPANWMKKLVAYYGALKKGEAPVIKSSADDMSWLRNRRVLLYTDSISRFQMHFFCQEIGEKPKILWQNAHHANECHLPHLNFTIVHWHHAGLYTYGNMTWFWLKSWEHIDFEWRFERYHEPTLPRAIGLSGRSPDLVLYGTIWDFRIFRHLSLSRDGNLHSFQRHITWEEARFYSARLKKFIAFVREKVGGQDVPIMYQSLTTQRESSKTAPNVELLDLDRVGRYVANKEGIEVFEWAKLIQAHEVIKDMWKDSVHPGKGPVSWLWGNMMLHYLFRAVGGVDVEGRIERMPAPGWNGHEAWHECREWNMLN